MKKRTFSVLYNWSKDVIILETTKETKRKFKAGTLLNYIRKGEDNVLMITEVHRHNIWFMFVETGTIRMTSKKAILDGIHKGHLRVLS